jgi:hypothetical protein
MTASPLSGPVYLVAHGGTMLPSLVARLQGEGLEVHLEGTLGISSKNMMSAVFDGLPDVPIESFDLDLQRGPNTLLGAVAGLCRGTPMKLAYAFADQEDALVNGNAQLTVGGCTPNAHGQHQRVRLRRMFRQPESMRTSPQAALGRQR